MEGDRAPSDGGIKTLLPGFDLAHLETGGSRPGWKRGTFLAAVAIMSIFILAAVFAGQFSLDDPLRAAGSAFQPPSARHWFGTDNLGRDVFGRIAFGARNTLAIGALTALVAAGVGGIVGGMSGYIGGIVDDILMRIVELVEIIPRFFLAVIVSATFGPSAIGIILLLGLTMWPDTARIVRSEVLSLKQRSFILAARGLGLSEPAIFIRHVLRNVMPIITVTGALHFGTVVLIQAGLGFLGLTDGSTISWGSMLQAAQPFLMIAWWPAVFPGAAITLLVLSANLLADGLTR
ncbi:MAG: ABC transporter permease [Pseudaminobacter sp.]